MIWRLAILVLLATAVAGGWWGATTGHRYRLRRRISAEPRTAIVFKSPHCAACRTQERILESLGSETAQRVRSVDVALDPEEAERFGVLTVPATVFFGRDGTVARIRYGVVEAADLERVLGVP